MPSIPYAKHSLDSRDKVAVLRVLRSDRLTQGPEVAAFESEFAKKVGAPYAVSFSSGTAALHAACYAAGLKRDRLMITSALTFVASANAGRYLRAQVKFADIDETWNVSKDTILKIPGLPRVILPVHFAGYPCNVRAIRSVNRTAQIIEDACHALGSPGVGSCEHSDFCCFSLHPSKAITSGEGGMVTCRTKANVKLLKKFRNHGFELSKGWYREQDSLGFNYRLSDIHAALGRSQLSKLDDFIAKRREIAQRYYEELKGVELPPYHDDHSWHLFVIRHPARGVIYNALKERGIESQVHYVPLPQNPYHRGEVPPNTARYFKECLSLPIFPALTDAEQTEVIEAVNDVV